MVAHALSDTGPFFSPANYAIVCQRGPRDFFSPLYLDRALFLQVVQLRRRTTYMFKTYDGIKLVDWVYSPYLILINKCSIDEKPHKPF